MRWLALLALVSAVALSVTGGASPSATRFACQVTVPGALFNGSGFGRYNVGTPRLATALPPFGVYVAVPDGQPGWAFVQRDGWIRTKVGWTRARGRLHIGGRRLDRVAPALQADIPTGYGTSGFQVTGLLFPTAGCWKVTGRAGGATLSFVVLVVKA